MCLSMMVAWGGFSIFTCFVAFWLLFPHFFTNLDKLSIYGISEASSTWFESYIIFIEKSIFSKKSKKKNFDVESFFFDWSGCLMAQKTVKWQGLNLFKCTFRFLKYPNIWIFGFRKKSKNLLPYIWALSFYGCFEPSTSLGPHSVLTNRYR